MPVHERRQHFRIEDQIYFDYKILEPGNCYSEHALQEDLLGNGGRRYVETMDYFREMDYELAELTQSLALKDPTIAHYLNLINAKIDYLVRHLMIGNKMRLRSVNISLGGMAFKTKEHVKEKTHLKVVIYTKPKMIPIIVNAVVVYSQYINQFNHHTAVQFENLTQEDEQLLSQHIMHSQTQCPSDS